MNMSVRDSIIARTEFLRSAFTSAFDRKEKTESGKAFIKELNRLLKVKEGGEDGDNKSVVLTFMTEGEVLINDVAVLGEELEKDFYNELRNLFWDADDIIVRDLSYNVPKYTIQLENNYIIEIHISDVLNHVIDLPSRG